VNLGPRVLAARADDHGAELELALPADHPLFDGHFPDIALLPGVGQILWAIEAARQYLRLQGAPVSLHQLKFLRLIQPGGTLQLALRLAPSAHEVAFRLLQRNELCASGRIRFTHA
jgi:3-hydroxymyristoyl/3-hydroxydecanoyl-(acyl carrier protein) dehydratase